MHSQHENRAEFMGIFSRKTSKIEDPDSALSNDNYSAQDDFGTDMLDNISSLSVDDLQLSSDDNEETEAALNEAEQEIEIETEEADMDLNEPEAVALDEFELETDIADEDLETVEAVAEDLVVAELEETESFDGDVDMVDDAIFELSDPEPEVSAAVAEIEEETEIEAQSEAEPEVEDVTDFETAADFDSNFEPLDHAAAMQAIVPKQTNRISHELTNFVEGFDEVADDYEILSGLLASTLR